MEIEEKDDVKEIDLLALAKKIWERRKMVVIWCAVGAVLGLVIGFSIPKEYQTEVKLAPEDNSGKSMSSSLGALAAMAGVNVGTSGGSDAVYPKLYPEIMQSVPFCLSLLDVPLTDIDGKRKFTVAEYLENYTRSPWWSVITGLPGKILGAFSSAKEDEPGAGHQPDPFKLTKKEKSLVDALNGAIQANVDTKTSVVTVSVTMQDPMVSAILADTVVSRLQEYVTDYRTNKARKDLEYIEKLNQEAKDSYYAAQQKYANYLDTHQGMVMYSAQTMRDRLENEATLAFNLFNQTSQQLQMAKAKVQEQTPVYATITPATVPIRPVAPRKMMILVGFIMLAFMACVGWILVVLPYKEASKGKKGVEDKSAE